MQTNETLKRLYEDYTSPYLKNIIIAALLSVIVASCTSAIAWLLDPAIKKIFIEKDKSLILIIPVAIIFAFAAKAASLYFAKLLMINVAEEIKKDLQANMLDSFISADTEFIDNKHTGKYISNLNFDVTQITRMLSDAYLSIVKDGFTLIGLLTVMFIQNWKLSLIAIVMIPLASITARVLGKRMGKVTTEAQEKSGDLNKYLLDLFKNHKIIKIFQREIFEKKRSKKFINDLKEKNIKIASVYMRSTPVMELFTGILIAVLIFFSGKLIIEEELELNNFFSFLAAMMLAYQPVKTLTKVNVVIGQGLSAAKRILPIVDTKNEINTNLEKENMKFNIGEIEFKNVFFSYQSNVTNSVLKNVSVRIDGKRMTALVGHSGSGKSTFLNLIPRIYDPIEGKITIDGQNLKMINLTSLRNKISIVDQNTTLFDDTVFNNIKYANPKATDEQIYNAAKLAMCESFVNKLDRGYETFIGENGTRLSGGEKQRLSIARAFLKNADIILLDEATSALDSETEQQIQIAINKLITNKTTIVIAHRLSTILNSNKILVFNKGEIVDVGTHADLLIKSALYKNFYEKQIQK
jgi:subfamily B ATP-binding cassette protein MsbA